MAKHLLIYIGLLFIAINPTDLSAEAPSRQDGYLLKHDSWIEDYIETMTLEEKIGQMTQAELSSLKGLQEIEELFLGSVLSGGDSDPAEGNSLDAWADTYDGCQKWARATRLKIPLLYGIDAVHGHNNVEGTVIFPHNIALGCARNAQLVQDISRATAIEMRATGIEWTFAPCVTVPRDDRWGRTYEGYSEDPRIVEVLGVAAVKGLQGDDISSPEQVLGCAKHFLGDGGTSKELRTDQGGHIDSGSKHKWDQGDVKCSVEELKEIHLGPYIKTINAGVGSIMPSYSSWNGVKCTGSHFLLTELLKEELGFKGFLISDYSAIDQVHEDYKEAIAISVNAGIDMAMVPNAHRKFITLLKELVEEGKVPEARINDAVKRILRVKKAMGMLEEDHAYEADRDLMEKVNSPAHQEIARKAVSQSLVLLKNESQCLPIAKGKKIQVCGVAADNLGIQCGGWTVDWQGNTNLSNELGDTILEAIESRATDNMVVDYNDVPSLNDDNEYDLTIYVLGERPYAEGKGDSDDLALPARDQELAQSIAKTQGKKVLVLMSGRPIPLTNDMMKADAIVAAWLPGTQGKGVTDVLFGDKDFRGKLSFTWPYKANDHPINVGALEVDPQFEVGYGLNYASEQAGMSGKKVSKVGASH